MQFPFLPKMFTGRRVAKELDYLSQDPGDHDAIPCSVTDFLCYPNRSLSFFRPQSPIWKTQIIALPWRVPCSQVLKKWWWWARIDWETETKWCGSVPSTKLILKKYFVCHTLHNYNHPAAPYNSIAKAMQRLVTSQKRTRISLLRPKFPLQLVWLFSFWVNFLLAHSCRTAHCGIGWPPVMAGGTCGNIWIQAGREAGECCCWHKLATELVQLHCQIIHWIHNNGNNAVQLTYKVLLMTREKRYRIA